MVCFSGMNNIKLNFGTPQNIEKQKLGLFKEGFAPHFLQKIHIKTTELKDVSLFDLLL